MTTAELLALSGGALTELRARNVVRTGNAPAGDLAELLVAQAMGGELAKKSQKSWDVRLPPPDGSLEGERVQVKARVVLNLKNKGERQVSAFRSWDFDSVMFVLFDGIYQVRAAALLPRQTVETRSSHVAYTSSDRVFATVDLLGLGEDWADRLRAVALWNATADTGQTRKEAA
jgi:hypothetical protein